MDVIKFVNIYFYKGQNPISVDNEFFEKNSFERNKEKKNNNSFRIIDRMLEICFVRVIRRFFSGNSRLGSRFFKYLNRKVFPM